jgi:hypothetical protein
MKVVIASNITPFLYDETSLLAGWLETMLRKAGHTVETLLFPFSRASPDVLNQMLAFRLLDLSDRTEHLIALHSPSSLLKHPRKTIWLHQPWPETTAALASADQCGFREARRLFTTSAAAAQILRQNNLNPQVLYPPIPGADRYRADDYGDSILYASRASDRDSLAIESSRHTTTPVRLDIVPCSVRDSARIERFASCLGVLCLPSDSATLDLTALEAYSARKCVITTEDAAGTRELVDHGRTGFVVAAKPEAIADAMDKLYSDRLLARRLGDDAAEHLQTLDIGWERVLESLLS